ncbi:N-acetylneuraminate synthase [Marinobacter sp. LV10R520-4]|uniref:N-acetylneuraminate synthase n=1 Tax=Marinobacter sp. LV10R520-4 TaxID=1761796 RepID=UPI000BF96A73|nr:N-acetylneuraminate synthase [Marinobacter sp. LV10R520-4]PFG53730.1 N-acetylneuraminate synthase [Marinobacter sp. LV10R520-4]
MKTLIIAEAGVNHNGDLNLAKKLIAVAAEAGADLVKFQTFVAKNMISKSAPKAEYQKVATDPEESQQDMVRKFELSKDDHLELIAECEKRSIGFFSTAFDQQSIELLEKFDFGLVKVPSGELTNLPYLRHLTRKSVPVLLSTGMANLGEIEAAIDAIEKAGTPRSLITVLHCTTEYPTPMEDVNLRAMVNIGKALGVKVGYSDHTPGIEVAIAAVALGATVIEKHFTLDRNLPGPDHRASLKPDELKAMVAGIRNIELAMGDGVKRPSASELKNKPIARKSLVALRAIKAGEVFTENNLTAKRPGTGLSPMRWDEIIGRTAPRDFISDELIEL